MTIVLPTDQDLTRTDQIKNNNNSLNISTNEIVQRQDLSLES